MLLVSIILLLMISCLRLIEHNYLSSSYLRAEIYREKEDITMAIVNYTQTIKLDPEDHDAFFKRAEMYEKVMIVFLLLLI